MQRGSRIRGVLFDVDGTLYHQAPVRAAMAAELLAHSVRARSPRTAATLRTFRRVREQLRDPGTRQAIPLDEQQYTAAAEASSETPAYVRALVDEWMFRRPLKYLRAARQRRVSELIARLQRDRVPLGVFSDYPADGKLRALGLDAAFSVVLCATDADVNAFKPHAEGFLRACARLGLPPDQVVYVGDRHDTDAAGAHAAGMRCYLVGRSLSLNPVRQAKDNSHGTRRFEDLQQLCRQTA